MFKVQQKEETAANCTTKVCAIFSDKVGIPITTSDIKVAQRTGQRSSTRARPILCDSLITRRETVSSSVGATSRTKVMPLGKTQRMQIIKCSEKRLNILLQCRCGVQMGKFLPRWRMVTLLEWTFTQIWMKLSGMSGNEMSADEEQIKNTCVLCQCLCSCAVERKGQGHNILLDQTWLYRGTTFIQLVDNYDGTHTPSPPLLIPSLSSLFHFCHPRPYLDLNERVNAQKLISVLLQHLLLVKARRFQVV